MFKFCDILPLSNVFKTIKHAAGGSIAYFSDTLSITLAANTGVIKRLFHISRNSKHNQHSISTPPAIIGKQLRRFFYE
ncbi:MAG: hypothetical protein RML37_05100 [Chitinophagales bacterium]|nr:hypothetical protein [Chitinophagales bacterium]